MMQTDIRPFGTTADGREVQALRIASPELAVTVLTYGAALQDVRLPGVAHSLTVGSPVIAAYEGPMVFCGTVVGPLANRLAGAEATIAGRSFRFAANDGPNLLHGGAHGIQTRVWTVAGTTSDSVTLTLTLPDGDSGFPGRRTFTAAYAVAGNALDLHLTATTDAPTLMNLASHSYWALDGDGGIAGQMLRIAADHYTPVDDALIPTGERRPVARQFDLRRGRRLDLTEAYDHNFCLAAAPRALTEAATLSGRGGIVMHLATTEPGLQVYDGAALSSGSFIGHRGVAYGAHDAMALEPQRWPDAPHHPDFPGVTLGSGETYSQHSRWTFTRP